MIITHTYAELEQASREGYERMRAWAAEVQRARLEGRIEEYSAADAYDAGRFNGQISQHKRDVSRRRYQGKRQATVRRVRAELEAAMKAKPSGEGGSKKVWYDMVSAKLGIGEDTIRKRLRGIEPPNWPRSWGTGSPGNGPNGGPNSTTEGKPKRKRKKAA